MDSQFTPLPPVEALDLNLGKMFDLEPIRPLFFVPKLDNRPQDPIIEAVDFGNAAPTHLPTSGRPTNGALATNGMNGDEKQAKGALKQEREQEEDLLLVWLRAARKEDHPPQVGLVIVSSSNIPDF